MELDVVCNYTPRFTIEVLRACVRVCGDERDCRCWWATGCLHRGSRSRCTMSCHHSRKCRAIVVGGFGDVH